MSDAERIYVAVFVDGGGNEYLDADWAATVGVDQTEYIRADLYEQLQAERDALKAEVESLQDKLLAANAECLAWRVRAENHQHGW